MPNEDDHFAMLKNLRIPTHLIPTDPRFGVGPSLIPLEHIKKLYDQGPHYMGTGHRTAPFKDIVQSVRDKISRYFQLPEDYTVLMGNGGATFLFDMIGLGLVRESSVHYTCGEFSNKWYKAHKNIPWIKTEKVSVDYGMGITPTEETCGDADFMACTLAETSTGAMIDHLPNIQGRDILLGVDATGGAGQCPCDVSKVDVFFFSPQKVFASDGGLFVCILSPKARARAEEIDQNVGRYVPHMMNWKTCLEHSEKNQTYTTSSLATVFLLNEQLKQLISFGGYEKVQEYARKKVKLLNEWIAKKDYLHHYIQEEKYRSLCVCTIDVDEKYNVSLILNFLKRQRLVYNINSYRKLNRNQFRVAFFHNITFENLQKLTKLLSFLIEQR